VGERRFEAPKASRGAGKRILVLSKRHRIPVVDMFVVTSCQKTFVNGKTAFDGIGRSQ